MVWFAYAFIISAILCIVLVIKIILMKKAVSEILEGFSEKLNDDTNTLISVSTNDKIMKRLANEINIQLKILRKQQNRFILGDTELKNAVTNISHDLRTPLTAISGYLDLLDREEKNENVSRYIGIIKNRIEIMKQLTEELFRYSVIISPEYGEKEEVLSVNSVLEESILAFYAVLQKRKITPNIHMPESKVVRKVNRAALSRVFSNLLNNAVKYSDGDLDIELTDEGKIIFSNTASKLSEIEAERLMERFYTVESAQKSTGLGLSIARTLVNQMNGTIESKYENGRLIISIFLPENVE